MSQKLSGVCDAFFGGTVSSCVATQYISHIAAPSACSPPWDRSDLWTPGCQEQRTLLLLGVDESRF